MKNLLMSLLILSGSAMASTQDATDALLSTLPAREYSGFTLQGESCTFYLHNEGSSVTITAEAGGLTKTARIRKDAVYRWNPGNRSFLHSAVERTADGSETNIFRTIAERADTQYMVIADQVITDRETVETSIECVVKY